MSDIILPYDPDPFIKTYPYLSFYLGILSGNQIEIQNLLINEFMHIFFFSGNPRRTVCDSCIERTLHSKFYDIPSL